jgi:hypothetical protein
MTIQYPIIGTISTFILVIGMVSNTAYAQSLSEFTLLLSKLGLTDFDSEGQCKHTLKEKLPQIISSADFDIKSKEVKHFISLYCAKFGDDDND